MKRPAKKAVKKKAVRKKKPVLLSSVPSQAIKQAIKDLIKVEGNKNYHVDMGLWHEPTHIEYRGNKEIQQCSVCLAGSVISRIAKDPTRDLTPNDFRDHKVGWHSLGDLLEGLDCFRKGFVMDGLEAFGISWIEMPIGLAEFVDVTEYGSDPDEFKGEMLELAGTLEKLGY
jgi:hypothetical protein